MSAPPQQARKPPPVARKSSATIPKAQPTAFYAGPTVPKKSKGAVPAPSTRETGSGVSKANVAGKNIEQIVNAKANPPPVVKKRASRPRQPSHRWLNSTILLILLASLFSLYACPSPNATDAHPSLYTRLNPFIATPHLIPGWETYLCNPTNVYRQKVLEPYVVPHVKARIQSIQGNPVVQGYIEPLLSRTQLVVNKVWAQHLQQPVTRASRVLAHLHNTHLAPRYPFLKARLHRLATYIRLRLTNASATAQRKITAHPTYAALQHRFTPLWKRISARVRETYHVLLPRVSHVHRTAKPHFWRIGGKAYGAGERGVEVARTEVVPRLARGVEVALDRVEDVYARVVEQLQQLYESILHPHIKQHLSIVRPHLDTLTTTIYEPYIHPTVTRLRPLLYSLVLTPSYTDIRRSIRAGYLDTRAAVSQGVESIKDSIGSAEQRIEDVVGDVKASFDGKKARGPARPDAEWRDYRGEAIDKARLAAEAAQESAARASGSVKQATDRAGDVVAAATGSIKSAADHAGSTVSSGVQNAASGVSSVAAQVSASVGSVVGGAAGAVSSKASHVAASGSSVVAGITRSAGSAASVASENAGSAASHVSASAGSVAAQVSSGVRHVAEEVIATGSSVGEYATRGVSQAGSQVSQSVVSGSSVVSAHVRDSADSVRSVAGQVSASASSVVDHATRGVSSAGSQASKSVGSVAARASAAVEPNVSTLDPLDPSATEIGTNPGKTTVPHNPEAEQAALFSEEGVKVREQVGSEDHVKDPTRLKQEAAGAVHAYLQTHVPKIAQDRLTALERDATATTRAFEQLLGKLELSSEAKDVAAERAKVKASLKRVRSKLDDLVSALESDLRHGLINAGAEKEVNKIIVVAIEAAGSNPPSTLRQTYYDAVHGVLDTLTNVNEAIAQEAGLVLKPYRKAAKDRADAALALLDGKATAAVMPTETVGRVAQAAAGTIGRAKDQIVADIKQATESGSSVYQSVTGGAASAASTAAGKLNLDEQAEAVLARMADFRNQVNQVVEDVTKRGKAGAASATQAVKDEL